MAVLAALAGALVFLACAGTCIYLDLHDTKDRR